MLANQVRGRLAHRFVIQRGVVPARVARRERRPHRAVEEDVAISPRERGVAGVKRRFDPPRPEHRDRIRQQGVDAAHPRALRARRRGVEVHHLSARVNATIGAAGAGHANRLGRDPGQCRLQGVLNRAAARLRLPAQEPAAVVFDAERDARG